MAIYSLSTKPISRNQGQSSVASAAYRAAEMLIDERLDRKFDYGAKQGVVYSRILTPENAPERLEDRSTLWNEIETVETRINSRLAREIRVALPVELTLEQQIALTEEFVKKTYVEKLGLVADINIHEKENNPHAHIMLTDRAWVGAHMGWESKKNTALNEKAALYEWRKEWEIYANEHLAAAGHEIQIDSRSYADQGMEELGLSAQPKVGTAWHWRKPSGSERMQKYRETAEENGRRIIENPSIGFKLLTRQQAHFDEYDIQKLAHRHSGSTEQYKRVSDAMLNSSEIVEIGPDKRGKELYTTRSVLAQEKEMLDTSQKLDLKQRHHVRERYIRRAIKHRGLTDAQSTVLKHIAKSKQISLVAGYAGSGKSYTLGAAREAYEKQGYRVIGLAPTGIAAEGLESGSGIESRTIARFLWDISEKQPYRYKTKFWMRGLTVDVQRERMPKRERLSKRDIIIVDEAGMVGTKNMQRLIDLAYCQRAKIVFVGSSQQLQSIESGGAFRALYDRIGGIELTEIWRQKESWMKEATVKFERDNGKEAKTAVDMYNDHQQIHGHADKNTALDAIVDEWRETALSNDKNDACLAIAYQNKDVNELNRRIREEARKIGKIDKTEYEYKTANGFRAFSVGDRILFQGNNERIGVRNGSLGTITDIHLGFVHIGFEVELDNKQRITFKTSAYNEFDHGYAATTHRVQGATIDNVIVYGDRFFDRHAALVALSRHKESVSLHYDEETFKNGYAELREAFGRDRSKLLATDVIDYRTKDLERLGPQNEKRSFVELSAETKQLLSEMSDTLTRQGETLRGRLQGEAEKRKENEQIKRDLDNYKRGINLVSYAHSMGYEVRQRLKHATVMHRDKDTIVVSTDRQGRGVYASTNRMRERLPDGKVKITHEEGNILNFVKERLKTETLTQIRKELEPWLTDKRGWHRQPEKKYLSSPDASKNAKDYATLVKKYDVWGSSAKKSKYLTQELGIDPNVIDDRFDRIVKSDFYNNAMFMHSNNDGEICGYEYRGITKDEKEISRFSRGGQLGLWRSSNTATADRIVITSGGVDALSHAQLHKTGRETAYISVGDKLSKAQEQDIKKLLRREGGRGAKIVLAVNKDNADMAGRLKKMSPESAEVERIVPHGKDWHDLLQRKLAQEWRDREKGIGFENEQERHRYNLVKAHMQSKIDAERSRDRGDDFGWER